MTVWNFVVWLHLVGMAFFVGGQIMLAAVVVPVLRSDRVGLLSAVRRFGVGTLLAFVILIATGVALATHEHRWGDSTLQVKMGLVALVLALIAAHARWPAARNPERVRNAEGVGSPEGVVNPAGGRNPDEGRNPKGVGNPDGGAAMRARMWRHLLELAIFAVSLAIVWLGIVLAG